MVGKYDIVLYNNKVHYHLNIKRNITVLRGDSASGKSELLRLITLYNSNPESSGITLICEKQCNVLTEENWKLFTETYSERIFFIDEGNTFLHTKEFTDTVRDADNYFVIVSREKLANLPYSIEEIYGLREGKNSGKYREAKQIYNEMYKIYGTYSTRIKDPALVITEDSNSGFEFYTQLFRERCVSSHGKSNVSNMLLSVDANSILVVVDGAAFGPEIQDCMEIINSSSKEISLYAPESFEYLILKAQLFNVPSSVIEETWKYADSSKYISWEQYYTQYLCDYSRNEVYQYSKKKLNDYYKTKGSVEKISRILPKELVPRM